MSISIQQPNSYPQNNPQVNHYIPQEQFYSQYQQPNIQVPFNYPPTNSVETSVSNKTNKIKS
jgi:hypothetical protein